MSSSRRPRKRGTSAGGNPFHPAHAYLAEYAVDQLKDEYPEIGAYRQDRAGHTRRAYFFLGALLHYVQDMGVPAYALLVYHQSSPSDWDNFEIGGRRFRCRGPLRVSTSATS